MLPRILTKRTAFVPALLLAPLLFVGCSPPKSSTPPSSGGMPPLTAMSGTGEIAPSDTDQFTFAAFGDNQGDSKADTIVSRIFQEIHDYQPTRPAFIFSLGDIVVGPFKDPLAELDIKQYMKKQFAKFLPLAKKAGVPVFNAPGNHEMDDWEEKPSADMHTIYMENVAPTYGAFDYGNSRFIALNTEDVPTPKSPPPPQGLADSFVSNEQLAQLDQDLATNRDKTHIFIMMHYPMEPKDSLNTLDPAAVKNLKEIFSKYDNISYILASHEHLYYNPQDPSNVDTIAPFKVGDPPVYLVSGGGGANMFGRSEADGGFHHYLIFQVDGDNITVQIHKISSSEDASDDSGDSSDDTEDATLGNSQ